MSINLYHIAAFSLANLLAHHNVHYYESKWLSRHFDHGIYDKLYTFTNLQTSNNGSENKNIVGHSFYFNMFQENVPVQFFLPNLKIATQHELSNPKDILDKIVSDRLIGKEGAYVSGGVIGEKFIGPVYPSSMYYVLNSLEIKSSDIIDKLLPDNILNPNTPKSANSRTLQTLASLLLGLIHDNKNAEILVMKESTFGKFQWSKVVDARITKVSKNIFSYEYDEIRFMSRDETMYTFNFFNQIIPSGILSSRSVCVNNEGCFVLELNYKMKIDMRKNKDQQKQLKLKKMKVVKPDKLSVL